MTVNPDKTRLTTLEEEGYQVVVVTWLQGLNNARRGHTIYVTKALYDQLNTTPSKDFKPTTAIQKRDKCYRPNSTNT